MTDFMNKPNPMDAALSAIPLPASVAEKVKNKSTVTVVGGQSGPVGGWNTVTGESRPTYHAKANPDDWNQIDLQWYLKNRYAEKYGVTLNIPLLLGHQSIKSIKYSLFKKLDYEPKHSVVKDYFDFCLTRHADEIIRSEGVFTLHKITKPKYILDYLDKNKIQPTATAPRQSASPVLVSDSTDALTMDDLTAAFRINSQYMVTNYGIVIPVNYLLSAKGKSLDEAIAYVQGAMTKLAAKGPQEMGAVIAATNKYQPYPKWLRFTDVAKIVKMTIAISDDNPVFAALK